MLASGTILRSKLHVPYEIVRLLGAGGQGEVYEVKSGGNSYALKWYFKHTATPEQREIIRQLIKKGSPNQNFLWPTDMITQADSFGYIMKLRPPRFKGIIDIMKRKADPSFDTLCVIGYNLADNYQQLHSIGYCYRDISFGNVFFDPDTGEVLICDNDNVSANGLNKSSVTGTQRFMAPEIVRGEASPSTDTDLFSMSVLMFYLFMLHHPLEGRLEADIKCLDAVAMGRLYGHAPVFIWDPADTSNRPVRGYQDNAIIYWDIYPDFLKRLFTTGFTEGISKPGRRIIEKQWKDATLRLRDSIMCCRFCGVENFYDPHKIREGKPHTCWACGVEAVVPARIKIGGNLVILDISTKLTEHHISNNYEIDKVIGEINRNPNNPSVWGIKNMADAAWVYKNADGSTIMIEPGKSAPIAALAKIDFGPAEGEIKA